MFILEFFKSVGVAVLDFFSGVDFMRFVTNAKYMGIGMLTIFIVIGVIILFTMALNKIFSGKGNE